MAFELSDELLAAVVPIIAFWVFSGIYEVVAYLLPDARLHSKEEEEEKNPPRLDVLKNVLTLQAVQILFVFLIFKAIGNDTRMQKPLQPSLLVAASQVLVAMVVMDTWEYFAHRFMHANKFAYKHLHSAHHDLIVPVPVGGLYGNWLDGIVIDNCGGVAAALVSGMSTRTSIFFFTLATVRGVDLHCAMWLPWSPFQMLFGNNPAFHDTHHQLRGLRCNYSQPFFLAWDKILGTYRPYSVVKRRGGGYQVQLSNK